MRKMECGNHQPQTTGFPWEDPEGRVTWCPNCAALHVHGEYMGKARPDPDDPGVWLYQPVIPLNWVNVTVRLDEVQDG